MKYYFNMDLYKYNQLDGDEKANILWDQGKFLHNRINDKKGANLYS